MSLAADLAAFNARLDKAIAETMETDVFVLARDCIIKSINENVYDKYNTPYPPENKDYYERQYEKGGLIDKQNIVLIGSGPIPDGYEIEVRDMRGAGSIDDDFPIDTIIESGVGYRWENSEIYKSQPFPRPFYEAAEKMAVEKGYLANTLKRGLAARGFTVV